MHARAFGPLFVAALALAPLVASCGDDASTSTGDPPAPTGTELVFDLTADLSNPERFFDAPWPSDLRVDAQGHPDWRGLPNVASVGAVEGFRATASESKGFPVLPVAYFRFTAPIAERSEADVIVPSADAPILLVDLSTGEAIPVVAKTLEPDNFTADRVLGVAPRPGFVLRPGTPHAVVVRKGANDVEGKPLAVSSTMQRLVSGTPEGEAESAASALYAPLWPALEALAIAKDDVVAATVFTTGEAVKVSSELGAAVVAKYDVAVEGLALDAAETHDGLCVLRGTVTMPQFQRGTPPFDSEGLFEFGMDGLPVVQREEQVPVVVVLPKQPMPAGGYPLVLNVHGSGGYSIAMVRPVGDDGKPGTPIGNAFPYTSKGLAMAGMAMPVNPERLPGAEETAYINPANLPAMRDTFRQGVIEARLFLEALSKVEIAPDVVAACAGPTLPMGETAFHFRADPVLLTGQSMGGMYTNLIGATEPRIEAVVPTGAGGHWTYFILETELQGGKFEGFLALLLGTPVKLSLLHPVLSLAAAAYEPSDPIVYMPHLARRPLEGHPARPIYEPVAPGDSYFPTTIYDAVAIAYGHRQVGEEAWPELQDALELAGVGGFESYPVTDNMTSEDGSKYTGVVVQYTGDGTYDPHAIYTRRDDVKRQYSCFFDSFVRTGRATVVEPTTNWQDPCP
jgi:hypothetical protein